MSMERHPLSRVVKEQYLRVEEAKQNVRPQAVPAIVLERKHIRMSEGSRSKPEHQQQTQTSSETAITTKDTAGSSTSPPVSTTAPSASLAVVTATTGTTSTTAAAPTTTTSPPAASTHPVTSKDGSKSPLPSVLATSPVAAPFVPPRSPRLSPRVRHRTTVTPTGASPSQVPSSPSVTTTITAATAVPTSATATVQAAPIVGGKRPLGEESPIIILIEPRDEEEKHDEARSPDLPESEGSSRQQRHELTKHEPQKPDPSTTQVSSLPSVSSSERGREPERGRESDKSKHGVQFSVTPAPKRDVAHVMEFFQEQEKSLQESFLSLPKKAVRKQRSPSPHVHPAQPSMGLEHLDNLIKLMEQLTSLKDENTRLRKRCDYLESTKVLLQAKQDLSFETSSSSSGFMTLPSHKSRHHHHRHFHPGRSKHGTDHLSRFPSEPGSGSAGGGGVGRMLSRPRLSSADELEFLEMVDSTSDQRPKRAKSAMHKRSFSTGSLEVPSELLDEVAGVEGRKRIKSKTGRSIFGGKHSGSKQKSKSSKWARVKKVLTGQKLYEDLGTTIRSLRELGKSTHVRYSTSGISSSPPDVYQASGGVPVERLSVHDGGLGGRAPLSLPPSAEPGSASSLKSADTDPDLTSEIWMGPPDWWEDYEAQRESGGTSTNSEVSSVIEVTTMYLGKKEPTTVSSTTTSSPLTSTSSPMTTSATSASSMSTGMPASQEKYLCVEMTLPRRMSSPSLIAKDGEEEDLLDDLTLITESSSHLLHKSSSCKSADLDLPKELSISPKSIDGRESKKFHKTAWGRVKDIIHTRKDSIKKKPKREKSGIDSEETSEIDMEALFEDQFRSDSFGEGLLGRSTPKTSPTVVRQSSKSISESPPGAVGFTRPGGTAKASLPVAGSPGNVDVATLLAGSVSDEFTRKMQEWEEKRARKSRSIRASMDDSDMGSIDVSSTSHEFPVRTIDLRDLRGKVPDSASEGPTPEESNTSMEVLGAPTINMEEMQKKMTDSFSRKMQEWERLKYKGSPLSVRDISPEIERKGSKGRKDDRQKSKRSREEKEKEKWERQRERDKQKVEREQVKLEKEKLRIEKERLRALEREAKLEKLKGRLSQSEMDPAFKNPVLSPLAEYKVTADFARKLHEWELMKGLSHDVSNSIYLEAQKLSMEHLRETGQQLDVLSKQERARMTLEGGVRSDNSADDKSSGPPVPPLTLQGYWESSEDTSPVEKYSEVSLADDDTCTSVTEECLTKSNIATMERANTQLLGELQKKEMEYAAVQDEVNKVNEKLAKVREEHAKEMARFHRELAQGEFTGPVKLEVGELETTMGQLEEKIKLMENFGEKLALSMESAAVGKWQSIEGEEAVHTQLVELVDQMRGMLIQATQSEEQSQKSSALSNFETLYSQAMKLQVQMNNLRLSHLERNREIMVIKRQLLLQEVNNLLLQADITRRETELYQFQEARRFASLKKWNTFGGTDRQRPQAQMELAAAAARSSQRKDAPGKMTEPRVNIPYIAEDVILASAASSSLSAPASPSAIAAAGGAPMAPSPTHSSSQAASRERSTDHRETHLLTPQAAARGGTWEVHHTAHTSHGDDGSKASGRSPPLRSTLQLPTYTTSSLRVQTSPSLTPSPYSSATPSPLSSPALDTTPTTPVSPDETLELSTTLTTSEPDTTLDKDTKAEKTSTKEDEQQVEKQQRKKPKSSKTEFMTICDSAPLHKEIEELKRAKSKVEKGSPTLKTSESSGSSSAPSPGRTPRQGSIPESPDQSIPKQRSVDKPKLHKAASIIDDDYSPTQSVMECTDTSPVVEQTRSTRDTDLGAVGGTDLLPPVADHRREQLPPTSDQSRPGSRSPRSPVSKQKLLRRQREERETKLKDYKAISPKGSPIFTRGKPPLPRQTTPVRQSPSASPAPPEKGPRSKSVGDMEPGPSSESASPSKPLQDAINKFEKRATVCETEDRPIELRKTPSPILHLPRVGLVSRVRRLKPAAELLEESQRYRSGHSIYATRIFQKYITKDDKPHAVSPSAINKENVSGTYVQAIVQRLSRETTPVGSAGSSRTNSNASLHRTEGSTRTQSELVSKIVRQLSTESGPSSPKTGTAPLKDLTNEGQVKQLKQTFSEQAAGKSSPERTLSETDIDRPQGVVRRSTKDKSHQRKSCEVAMVLTSSTSPTSEASYEFISCLSTSSVDRRKPDEPEAGPSNHMSLPTLVPSSKPAPIEGVGRGRAATYSAPEETDSGKKDSKGKSKASKRQSKSREGKGESGRLPSSSLSPERRGGAGRGKMGTVGVLCKQSISFDLGVSLYTQKHETTEDPRKPRSWDPSESVRAEAAAAAAAAAAGAEADLPSPSSPAGSSHEGGSTERRPISSSSEGDGAPSSPTTEEKKKSRRFLDSSWLQKSKKFFKVSK